MSTVTLTVKDLIKILKKVRNKDAVLYVTCNGVQGEEFSSIADETVFPPEADGHIGNVFFKLDEQGSFVRAIKYS